MRSRDVVPSFGREYLTDDAFDNPSTKRGLLLRRASKWSVLSQFVPRLITPFSTLILASILCPEDFGIVATCGIVISLAQNLAGLGFGSALIQRASDIDRSATVAFWANLGMAVCLIMIVCVGAPHLASVYRLSLISQVLGVSSVSLLFSACASVPLAIMQRKLAFRQLFWINLGASVVGVILSVIAALAGAGVWSLVVGPVVSSSINCVAAWMRSSWRPHMYFSLAVCRSMFKFSFWIVVSGFQTWLFLSSDNLIAGYNFGPKVLGIYALGFNLANLAPGMIGAAVSPLAYSAFCRMQTDVGAVAHALLKIQEMAAAVVIPTAFLLSAVSMPAVTLLYGDKWEGLGYVVSVMAILPGVGNIWSLNAEAFRATGRPQAWVIIAAVDLAVMLPCLFLSRSFGFDWFVGVRCAGAALLVGLVVVATKALMSVSVRNQAKAIGWPLFLSIVMFGLVRCLLFVFSPVSGLRGWGLLALSAILGCMTYTILFRILCRTVWDEVKSMLAIWSMKTIDLSPVLPSEG